MALFAASVDPPEKNRRFAESLELDYPILSDPTKRVARAYGALKAGMFPMRVTVYVGPSGTVLHVDRDVKPASAGADVAARLAELGVPEIDRG